MHVTWLAISVDIDAGDVEQTYALVCMLNFAVFCSHGCVFTQVLSQTFGGVGPARRGTRANNHAYVDDHYLYLTPQIQIVSRTKELIV